MTYWLSLRHPSTSKKQNNLTSQTVWFRIEYLLLFTGGLLLLRFFLRRLRFTSEMWSLSPLRPLYVALCSPFSRNWFMLFHTFRYIVSFSFLAFLGRRLRFVWMRWNSYTSNVRRMAGACSLKRLQVRGEGWQWLFHPEKCPDSRFYQNVILAFIKNLINVKHISITSFLSSTSIAYMSSSTSTSSSSAMVWECWGRVRSHLLLLKASFYWLKKKGKPEQTKEREE